MSPPFDVNEDDDLDYSEFNFELSENPRDNESDLYELIYGEPLPDLPDESDEDFDENDEKLDDGKLRDFMKDWDWKPSSGES